MLRLRAGSTTAPLSVDATHAVKLRQREHVRNRIGIVLGGGLLFALAFIAAYLIGRDPAAPAAPPVTTWRGSALTTLPGTTPRLAEPIVPAASLPPLRIKKTLTAGVASSPQTHSTISPPLESPATAVTTAAVTTQPKSKPKHAPPATTTGPPKLITVTN